MIDKLTALTKGTPLSEIYDYVKNDSRLHNKIKKAVDAGEDFEDLISYILKRRSYSKTSVVFVEKIRKVITDAADAIDDAIDAIAPKPVTQDDTVAVPNHTISLTKEKTRDFMNELTLDLANDVFGNWGEEIDDWREYDKDVFNEIFEDLKKKQRKIIIARAVIIRKFEMIMNVRYEQSAHYMVAYLITLA